MKNFALAGNPNCGKTTLFNILTGSTAHVGNWPGVTVDKKEGICKKGNEAVSIIDLPGIYSLSPYTNEEVISRDYLLSGNVDCIINIVDATNLERNLYLTTQLMETNIPIVIALNMMDILEKNQETIDCKALEQLFNLPVVSISALKENHIDVLIQKAIEYSNKKREPFTVLSGSSISKLIQNINQEMKRQNIDNSLFHAIKLIELDEIEVQNHKEFVPIVEEYKKNYKSELFDTDFEALIADARYKYITKEMDIIKKSSHRAIIETTKSEKIDKVLTSKWLGIPIFLVILFLIFHFTFSENLFYLGGFFKNCKPSFDGTIFSGLIWTESGLNSLGVILQNLVVNLTDYITELVQGLLINSPSWVSGLVCDGILGGVFSVLSFVPQILLLFFFFSILEDTGYMARVAFILDKIFRRYGLSGRSFMPMMMGFGCSVPAMINTRTLIDDDERTATIRVIPFFSCGAKLPILTAIAGAMCQVFHFSNVDLITYSMYLIGILTAIFTIFIMKNTVMKGKSSPFIMELPNYHIPQFKSLMIHLWDKLKHFIHKAFTIILASTILIWFLQSFTWKVQYIEQINISEITEETFVGMLENTDFQNKIIELNDEYDISNIQFSTIVEDQELVINEEQALKYNMVIEQVFQEALEKYNSITQDSNYLDTSNSILASIGKVIQPVFTPLGFGSNLNKENGWVFGVSALTGLVAKENVIATFTVLAQCTTNKMITSVESFKELYFTVLDEDGINASIQMIQNTGASKNYGILISFILFNMTTIPCFAAVATSKAEINNKKKFIHTLLFWIVTSYLLSSLVYCILTWWWTAFIIGTLLFLVILLLHLSNRKSMKSTYKGA